jgi:hypothetical protein
MALDGTLSDSRQYAVANAVIRPIIILFFVRVPHMRPQLLLALFLLIASDALAQLGGSGTYSFLNVTTSARNAAMGGSMSAIKDGDLDLVYLNPAILDTSMHNYLVTDFTNYFADINYGYVGYAHTFKKVGTFAAGLKHINYGSFTQADELGNIQGTFAANDGVFHLSYARPFGKYFSTGAAFKMIYSQYADYGSFGMALDLAAMFHDPSTDWSVSIVARNLGSQLDPYIAGNYEALPIGLDIGISKKLKYVPLRMSMIIRDLQQPDLTYRDPTNSPPSIDPLTGEVNEYKVDIGDAIMRHLIFSAELTIAKRIMVRMGYNYGRRQELKVSSKPGTAGFSWGVGVKINRFTISYGRATYHLAGGTNQFSISTNLGQHIKVVRPPKPPKEKKQKESDAPAKTDG